MQNLIQKARRTDPLDGAFKLKPGLTICWMSDRSDFNPAVMEDLLDFICEKTGITGFPSAAWGALPEEGIVINPEDAPVDCPEEVKDQAYRLEITEKRIVVTGHIAGLRYGLQTLAQFIDQSHESLACCLVEDYPGIAERGLIYDVTRGKIPTLETLKNLADLCVTLKMNQLQLYVEHSFAFSFLSEIQGGEDVITPGEILALDAYCRDRGVELVPCLASFGHLYMILSTRSWEEYCEKENSSLQEFSFYSRQREHTINISHRGSVDFIRRFQKEFLPLFSSRRFNICADETFDLGTGRSRKMTEQKGAGRSYLDFLLKIMEYPREMGFRIMLFGDILINHPELIGEIPSDVIFLDWEYSPSPKREERELFSRAEQEHWLIPAVWGWNRLINDYSNAYDNIRSMTKYASELMAEGILISHWGDYGHTLPLSICMPALAVGSALSWNPSDDRGCLELMHSWCRHRYGAAGDEWGDILFQAGGDPAFTFRELVWWIEKSDFSEVKSYDDREIRNKTEELNALKNRVHSFGHRVPANCRGDVSDLHMALEGQYLFTALYPIVRTYFMGEPMELIYPAGELAIRFEEWMDSFIRSWRLRNKESEVRRIITLIRIMCRKLRDCQNKV